MAFTVTCPCGKSPAPQVTKTFQRNNGLAADGVCGMKTIELLFK